MPNLYGNAADGVAGVGLAGAGFVAVASGIKGVAFGISGLGVDTGVVGVTFGAAGVGVASLAQAKEKGITKIRIKQNATNLLWSHLYIETLLF